MCGSEIVFIIPTRASCLADISNEGRKEKTKENKHKGPKSCVSYLKMWSVLWIMQLGKFCHKIHSPWAYFSHVNGAYTADNLSWLCHYSVDREIFSSPKTGLKQ